MNKMRVRISEIGECAADILIYVIVCLMFVIMILGSILVISGIIYGISLLLLEVIQLWK